MRTIFWQIFVTFVVVGGFAYFAILANFNSRLNLLWMLGVPLGTAIGANWNRGVGCAIGMAILLLVTAIAALATMVSYTGA
jgi:hypothetical protein